MDDRKSIINYSRALEFLTEVSVGVAHRDRVGISFCSWIFARCCGENESKINDVVVGCQCGKRQSFPPTGLQTNPASSSSADLKIVYNSPKSVQIQMRPCFPAFGAVFTLFLLVLTASIGMMQCCDREKKVKLLCNEGQFGRGLPNILT